jgi:acyl dehydratase
MTPDETPALSDVTYDELEVGQVLGTVTEPVSAEMAGSLAGEIGAPGEAAIAPPAVFPVLFLKALRRTLGGIPNGGVLAKYDFRFGAPLKTGGEVQVEVSIADKYVRRERPYVVVQFAIDGEDGERALTGLKTIMWPTGPEAR